MNPLKEFVNNLSDDEKIQIMKDYNQFEKDGFIGDSAIRTNARKLIRQLGANENMITMWMKDIAFECYREYAWKYVGLRE